MKGQIATTLGFTGHIGSHLYLLIFLRCPCSLTTAPRLYPNRLHMKVAVAYFKLIVSVRKGLT